MTPSSLDTTWSIPSLGLSHFKWIQAVPIALWWPSKAAMADSDVSAQGRPGSCFFTASGVNHHRTHDDLRLTRGRAILWGQQQTQPSV